MKHDAGIELQDTPGATRRANHEARGRSVSVRTFLLLLALMFVWSLLMQTFGGADVYAVMGPYALIVIALSWALAGKRLTFLLRPRLDSVVRGAALGTLMTLGTYPTFRLALGWFPALGPQVESLYGAAHTSHRAWAALWVCALVLAEELLWRGVFLDALCARSTSRAAFVVSVLSYALAQLGSGSGIVFLLALVCGSIWTLQRLRSDSLLGPLIAHLIWTETVIVLWPVT